MNIITEDLHRQGYSIQNALFSVEQLNSLRSEILGLYHSNLFKKAGIGREGLIQKNVRGDFIHWFNSQKLLEEQKRIWEFLEKLRVELNEKLYLGLRDFELHAALYPAHTFYKRHLDQFKDTHKKRLISFILYLNPDWVLEDGGELCIYDPKQPTRILEKILPTFGKCVFFLSSEFEHEVLVTNKERLSITGWMYQYQ